MKYPVCKDVNLAPGCGAIPRANASPRRMSAPS